MTNIGMTKLRMVRKVGDSNVRIRIDIKNSSQQVGLLPNVN